MDRRRSSTLHATALRQQLANSVWERDYFRLTARSPGQLASSLRSLVCPAMKALVLALALVS